MHLGERQYLHPEKWRDALAATGALQGVPGAVGLWVSRSGGFPLAHRPASAYEPAIAFNFKHCLVLRSFYLNKFIFQLPWESMLLKQHSVKILPRQTPRVGLVKMWSEEGPLSEVHMPSIPPSHIIVAV